MLAQFARKTAVVVVATSIILGAAGCASEEVVAGDYPDITLAQSKSPTQLLRNETAGRLPKGSIGEVVQTNDTSVACLDEKEDPKGTVRHWESMVKITLTDDDELPNIVKKLVKSLEAQGWVAPALGGTARDGSKLLASETAAQTIQIVGLDPNEVRLDVSNELAAPAASVVILVNGPCVRTDGAGSKEVLKLEEAGKGK